MACWMHCGRRLESYVVFAALFRGGWSEKGPEVARRGACFISYEAYSMQVDAEEVEEKLEDRLHRLET